MPLAPICLTAAIVLMLASVFLRDTSRPMSDIRKVQLLSAGLFSLAWMTTRPSYYLFLPYPADVLVVPGFASLMTVALASYAMDRDSKVRRSFAVACVVANAMLLLWVIARTVPEIDVFTFNQEACKAILRGDNPYAISMPNIYPEGSPFYDPKEVVDGRVMRGFTYPPINLIATLPSYLIWGDVRYTFAAAFTLTGLLAIFTHRTPLCAFCGLLLLAVPFQVHLVAAAWTEPLQLLCLGAAVFAWPRSGWVAAVALGLFLSCKQYSVFFLPALYFVLPRPLSLKSTSVFLGVVMVTALAVSLPVVLWDFRAFWHSAVAAVMAGRFRYDSLSFPALIYSGDGAEPSTILAYPVCAIVCGVCLWRLRPGMSSFCLTVGAVGTLLFALNKYAFGNYYHLLAGALVLSVVASLESKVSGATK